MSDLSTFVFDGCDVRVVTIDGEPWWIARDVLDILGLGNVSKALSRVDEADVTSSAVSSGAQRRNMYMVNESGLYDLILDSRKPEARRFRRWITAEVLPTIRKSGGAYIEPGSRAEAELSNPDTMLEKFAELLSLARSERAKAVASEARNIELEAKVVIDAPKVAAWDQFANADGAYSIGTVAKILGNIGQNTLFKLLRQNDVLIEGGDMHNTPYQRYAHHFKVITKTRNIDGKKRSSYKTLVPPSDLPFVARKAGIPLPDASTINEILATEREVIHA
ncbi:phage antirepressor [Mycobacteroides abscessus]|uniref:phage antirepressor n=1 Tax=Mycobacteroides abscessus TaxID=36809 RepID=UPI00092B4470|nr:phage antirepressor KilAC domain-containing protein [Mycobacteroides abscessus]SHY53096.1 gp54 protein [Mycobacteroides abscessus subsp. abscessus]SHY62619.1 gp54 protein [Mycobacteroides abscessus subsp. abscessus]SHY72260.1 gp54 protein [Mycobacteroides abscessus subsp. abscessus]SIA15663.1 gp54 protein [Mycobacteroides abscessus subsp. abscessus]SIB17441.1 gp54 protein [Mycobacteroides abscessus subsp. abscessus]